MSENSDIDCLKENFKLVDLQAPRGIHPKLFSLVKPPIEKVFSLTTLNQVYRGIRQRIPDQAFLTPRWQSWMFSMRCRRTI